MIAFFFTMPISRMMPISAMTLSSVRQTQQRQQRAHAGRGQRGEDGERVDVALVQHAEDDVHRDQRRGDQQGLAGQRGLEGLRRALEAALDAGGQPERAAPRPRSRVTASPSATPGARLNDSVTAGNCAWWFTASAVRGGLVAAERAERHLPPLRGRHVDVPQRLGTLPEARLDLHHHVVLVQRRVHVATCRWPKAS